MEVHLRNLQARYAGVAYETVGEEIHITIPDRHRIGHEAHFAQVLTQFLKYLGASKSMPAWERTNMIAKYTVSTTGVVAPTRQRRGRGACCGQNSFPGGDTETSTPVCDSIGSALLTPAPTARPTTPSLRRIGPQKSIPEPRTRQHTTGAIRIATLRRPKQHLADSSCRSGGTPR